MVAILNDFREAVEQGRAPVASGEAGLLVLDSVLGAYVAGATGEEVALPLPASHPTYAKGSTGIADLDLPSDSPARKRGLFGLPRSG
jgi:hypothetical protein